MLGVDAGVEHGDDDPARALGHGPRLGQADLAQAPLLRPVGVVRRQVESLDERLAARVRNQCGTPQCRKGPFALLRVDGDEVGVELRDRGPSLAIDPRQVAGLPLDGRNFLELALLAPGTAPAPQGSASSVRGDFSFSEEPVREPDDGEALVDISYISLDPAMRGWMTDLPSYIPPVGIGEVMRALAAGRVIASKHPGVAEGDRVTGLLGAQRYATVSGDALNKVDTDLAPLPVHLGTLGMPGTTAYFGLQGLALLLERAPAGRKLGLARGRRGRLFTIAVAALPAFWLFHPAFVINVVLPFLKVVGAR